MKSFAKSEIEDIENQKASLSISKYNPTDSDVLTLSLTWDEEFEEPFHDDKVVLPTSRKINVDEGSVRDISTDIFPKLVNKIDFNGTIDSITLKQNNILIGLSRLGQITERGDSILNQIVNVSKGYNVNFTKDNIVESNVAYSDSNVCEVFSVDAYIRTKSPSEYLSNVNSYADTVEKIDDSRDFIDSDYYIVPFSLSREHLSDTHINKYEDHMKSFVDDYLSTDFTYELEGGSIYIMSGAINDSDYCIARPHFGYTKPDANQNVRCWLHTDTTKVLDLTLTSSCE